MTEHIRSKNHSPMPSMLIERVPGSCSRCTGFHHDFDCPIGMLIWQWRLRFWWDVQHPVMFANVSS